MQKEFDVSTILIVNSIEDTVNELKSTLPLHSVRVIQNEESAKNEFLMAQSNLAIKEAYIASNQIKYIILCGSTFRKEAQNALLKVLEEPPKNTVFILVSNSKSTFLPTIFSRLRVKYQKKIANIEEFSLDIKRLDLKMSYNYLKEKQKISGQEAKNEIQSILHAIHKNNIKLTRKELELFSSSIKLLDLNSRPINVLTNLFITLLHIRKRC